MSSETDIPALPVATKEQQKRGMFHGVLLQVVSAPGALIFDNGLMLLYLSKLHFADQHIIILISTKVGMTMLLAPSAAYVSDRIGIKRVGLIGCLLSFIGFGLLTFGPTMSDALARPLVVVGIVAFSAGLGLFNGGWFSLLKGFVPTHITGRFFGFLRMSWQLAAALIVFAYSLFLKGDSELWVFQLVLSFLLVGQGFKIWSYMQLPEISLRADRGLSFIGALKQVLPSPQFMPLCAYSFLLSLFTTAGPMLFNLVEKRHMDLGDNTIAMLGGAAMLGALVGFPLGGFIVDRKGTKVVFMCCHLGFMLTAAMFPMRGVLPVDPILPLAVLHFVWGLFLAGSSIAMSTELFAVMPVHNRSLASAVWWSLSNGGGMLSGMMAAGAVSLGFLSPTWHFMGSVVSQYDALILIYGCMTGLMAVTLGLIPSVIGEPQWMPRGSQ